MKQKTNCKFCSKRFTKRHVSQKFCCKKHKDKFHNENNPRGFYAKTESEDYDDDPGWGSHNY